MTDIKDVIKLLNPWWTEDSISDELAMPYKRHFFNKIEEFKEYRQIVILSGLRRVGKTTLLYQMIHKLLPAMSNGNLDDIGDVIFDYRFNMGSIKNCSFLYPEINTIADNIAHLKLNNTAAVLALSSVGPLFFAVTDKLTAKGKNINKLQYSEVEYSISEGDDEKAFYPDR